tara:strand:- start:39 stop:320 length:282 start_codon:yes stop_codon:yes gene_type:complete
MNHTIYKNIADLNVSEDDPTAYLSIIISPRISKVVNIIAWLHKNILGLDEKSITVSLNQDNSVREIGLGKTLTTKEKKLITDKYPYLKGKEIG